MKKAVIIIITTTLVGLYMVLIVGYLTSNIYGNHLRKANSYRQFKRLAEDLPDVYLPDQNESGMTQWEYVMYLEGPKIYSTRRGYSATALKDGIYLIIDVQRIDSLISESPDMDEVDLQQLAGQYESQYAGKTIRHTVFEEYMGNLMHKYEKRLQFTDGDYRYRIIAFFHVNYTHEQDDHYVSKDDIETAKETILDWVTGETRNVIDHLVNN